MLSANLLFELLGKEELSLDTFSLLIEYIHCFGVQGFEQTIYTWLKEKYPIVIKFQLIDLLVELYSLEKLSSESFTTLSFPAKEEQMIKQYIQSLQKKTKAPITGLTILQSMFYGDFENSGKGNNGGLAIFLKSLGNELSKSKEIARMLTLTITNDWSNNHSLIKNYSKRHLLLSVPIHVDSSKATDFLQKEYFIKRTIRRFLERFQLMPDVFHVRFLDNASKAMANLSKDLGKKLIVTLTPDPHRNMTKQIGSFDTFPLNDWIEKFNKIIIGDEFISESDQIVGIGNLVVKEELEMYFPQLLRVENREKVRMISEGIQIDLTIMNREEIMTDKSFNKLGLTEKFLEKPIILNVGRLNKLKAQDQLIQAWGSSTLSDIYHLVIVGGDLEQPDLEEEKMMRTFEKILKEKPVLKDKFLHLGALSNYQVRKLEKKIRAAQKNYPQIYLCSSKKEEFGIAILEALSQELLVLGPIKGGVKSYLSNDQNGFLIDTTDSQSIAQATERIVNQLKNKNNIFEKIQRAGKRTVEENFSMKTIAEDFLSLYLSV